MIPYLTEPTGLARQESKHDVTGIKTNALAKFHAL